MAKSLKCKIGPSVLNSDLSILYHESQKLLDSGADFLHLDVMDGHFVPNLSFGHPVVKCLRSRIKDAFFETHMMVTEPIKWIEPMQDAGVDQYTFHVESVDDVELVCRKIKEAGMRVGLALKPGTPVNDIVMYIPMVDMILVMTVEPGFGGQRFLLDQVEKVRWLRKEYPLMNIEVEGGIGPCTIDTCADAGANMIISGTAVINSPDQRSTILSLKQAVESVIRKYPQ